MEQGIEHIQCHHFFSMGVSVLILMEGKLFSACIVDAKRNAQVIAKKEQELSICMYDSAAFA